MAKREFKKIVTVGARGFKTIATIAELDTRVKAGKVLVYDIGNITQDEFKKSLDNFVAAHEPRKPILICTEGKKWSSPSILDNSHEIVFRNRDKK